QRTVAEPLSRFQGKMSRQAGKFRRPVEREGTDCGRRRQKFAQAPTQLALFDRAWDTEPMDGSAANDFDLGPGFLQQDRGLTRALAAADDGHLLSPELPEIVVLAGVAHNLGRQSPEFDRPEFLVRKSRGNHDMTGAENLAVVERQPKSSARCLNASDLSGV